MFTDAEITRLAQKHWQSLRKAGLFLDACQGSHFGQMFKATIQCHGDRDAALEAFAKWFASTPSILICDYIATWHGTYSGFVKALREGGEHYCSEAVNAGYNCAMGEILARKRELERRSA